MRRLKVVDGEGWYHVYCRTACEKGVYPLEKELCKKKFVSLMKYYARAYFCNIAAFCVMGNHYHIVLKFEIPRKIKGTELYFNLSILYLCPSMYLCVWVCVSLYSF